MNKQELRLFVEKNPKLVKMTESKTFPGLFVLKYTKKVFYNGLWNKFLAECRGTVVDTDFNVVSYPFTKIYNYGIEKDAPILEDDAEITVYGKVNGFMVAVTVHHNELLVTTTGSTDSDFVTYAKEMMATHCSLDEWLMILGTDDCQDMTFMFECCHPLDPHIVPETAGMYLLGYREKIWGSAVGYNPEILTSVAESLKCRLPDVMYCTLSHLKSLVKDCKTEGYVFYTAAGVSAKIKSPYYLVSKWVARNPKVDKLIDKNRDIKKSIDEEYHGLIDAIRQNITGYTVMNEQQRLSWVRHYLA
jgi:hypothetical protein